MELKIPLTYPTSHTQTFDKLLTQGFYFHPFSVLLGLLTHTSAHLAPSLSFLSFVFIIETRVFVEGQPKNKIKNNRVHTS